MQRDYDNLKEDNIGVLEIQNESSFFYAILILDDEGDCVLVENGKLLLFKNTTNLKFWVQGNFFLDINDLKNKMICCYFDDAIYFVANEKRVENSWLLDTINSIIDILKTINSLERKLKLKLYSFANFLTFNLEIDTFFESKYSRIDMLEAVKEARNIIFYEFSVFLKEV